MAGDLARRGAASSAARVYERAGALSPTRSARSARSLRAAECWLEACTPEAAALALVDVDTDADVDVLLGAVAVERWVRGPVAALERVRAVNDGALRAFARAIEADLLFDAVGESAARDLGSQVLEDSRRRSRGSAPRRSRHHARDGRSDRDRRC